MLNPHSRVFASRPIAARLRMPLLVLIILGMCGLAALTVPQAARAAVSPTITNFDGAGHQISRFDVDGNALDAHDGQIALFSGTYYLYGTSYDCGYQYQHNATFCGFKVYSSPDLVHWTDRGMVVNARSCNYCFRPHVLFNTGSGKYVLWVNDGNAPQGYRVYTNATPTGLFTEQSTPTLAVACGIDFSLYADADGTAYIIHNDACNGVDIVVEQLTSNYQSTNGSYVRLHVSNVEAPAMFKRGSTYYIAMSDPTCAYCGSTGTGYMTAMTPLGAWTGSSFNSSTGLWTTTKISTTSCGGQPAHVAPLPLQDGTTAYLYMSDLWNNYDPNESLANYYWAPLGFNGDGSIQPITCAATASLALANGTTGSQSAPADLDQTSGADGFRHYCDIAGNVQRLQTFTPGRTGTLTNVSLTSFQHGSPNAPLIIDIVDAQAQPNGSVLSEMTVPTASVGWAPHGITIWPNIVVTAGHRYSIIGRSATTQGCYGWEYNDANPYPAGTEYYSTNNGGSFTAEAGRALKFFTTVAVPAPQIDQHNDAASFTNYNDIAANVERMQTFTPTSVSLNRLDLWTYRNGNPVSGFTVSITTVDGANNPVTPLYTTTLPASALTPATNGGWLVVYPRLTNLTPGQHYALVLASPASLSNGSTDAFGWAYNDGNVYAGGVERYSTNTGASWTSEANRSIKFITYTAANSAISSSTLGGWPTSNVVDGDATTAWVSNTHGTVTNAEEWIGVNLGAPRTLTGLVVSPRQYQGTTQCFPTSFTIQQSSDGSHWTTITGQAYTNYNGGVAPTTAQRWQFAAPVTAQYLRMDATTLAPDIYSNTYFELAEFTVAIAP